MLQLFQVQYFLQKKKKSSIFFFKFKIVSFSQKQSYNHKIYRHYTFGSKLKICQRNCHKNQHLWIFDDFGKNNFDFLPNLRFCEVYLRGFKIVGNRQTQKILFSPSRKMHADSNSYYTRMTNRCDFSCNSVVLFGSKSTTKKRWKTLPL